MFLRLQPVTTFALKDGGRKQLESTAICTARRQSPFYLLLIVVKIHYSFNRWRETTEEFVFEKADHNLLENKYYLELFLLVYDLINGSWQ
jgi:hypothetical protein